MDETHFQIYGATLLCEEVPQLDKAALLESLRKRCGRVDDMNTSELLAFAYLDHPVQYKDGSVPAQSVINVIDSTPPPDVIQPSVEQSWDWREVRNVLPRVRAQVMVSDFLASGLPYKERLALFHNIMLSVLEHVPCLGIRWWSSQQIVSTQSYLDSKQPGRAPSQLIVYPAVNVRLFRITNRAPGETLMDTMGLAAFGLPDLQCHFVGLEPSAVAYMLQNTAYYVFDQGDVIGNGHTVMGVNPDDAWVCRHEKAIVGPEREVLDINPGPPYTDGIRN